MKSCAEYQQLLLEHLFELLEPDQQRELEEHLHGCSACRAALEQARREKAWLREAACWSFEGVHFEPPAPAELAHQRSASRPSVPGGPLIAFVAENLPLWTLAASLLLAVGLAVWWTGLGNGRGSDQASLSPQAASRPVMEPMTEAGGISYEGARAELDAAKNHDRARQQTPQRVGESLRQSPSAGEKAQAARKSLCDEAADAGQTPSPRRGVPDQASEKGRGSLQLRGAHAAAGAAGGPSGAPNVDGAGQGAAAPLPAGASMGLAVASPRPAQSGLPPTALAGFTAFHVERVWDQQGPQVRAQIIEFLDSSPHGELQVAGEQLRRNVERGVVALILPAQMREQLRSFQSPAAGLQGAATPPSPKAGQESALAAQSLNQVQISSMDRQALQNVRRSQEFLAQLPPRGRQFAAIPAQAVVEVPLEQGKLSHWVSAVQLPLASQYVPAVRLEYEASTKQLLIQLMVLDSQNLHPIELKAKLSARLLGESGQPLGGEQVAQMELVRRKSAESSSAFVQQPPYLYEGRLPWPAGRTSASWLEITDEQGLLVSIRLLLKPPGQPSGDQVPQRHPPTGTIPAVRGIALAVRSLASDEASAWWSATAAFVRWAEPTQRWRGAICCSDHQLALQLGLLANRQNDMTALERSVYEQVRAHLRKHNGDWLVQPRQTWSALGRPGGNISPPARMEESRQLAEFLRQLVSSPKRGDAHLGLLSVGVLAALGWLALACGIFGAINGRQQYLFWSRRILSLLVLFIALWWAWTRAEAQAPADKSPNPTLQAPRLGGWPLAQRQE